MLTDLLASFTCLPDPRCAGRTRHRLLNMLVIAVCAVPVVSAFATQQGLSLGQVAVSGKGQELTAIPVLLTSLCLATTIVTLDAFGCQQATARQLLGQQAAYILALKGNQGRCHRAVGAYCQATCFERWASYPAD